MKIIASLLFALLIVLQSMLWFGQHGVFQLWGLEQTIEQEKQKNAELAKRNDQLHAEVQELKQGKEALEERARSQLGMIKEGEKFYRVIPVKQKKQQEK